MQVHISDTKGTIYCGEGLPLKDGEIPIVDILNNVSSLNSTIRGTIELAEGHLHRENAKTDQYGSFLSAVGLIVIACWHYLPSLLKSIVIMQMFAVQCTIFKDII